jgi:GT2 family glycosyltransferase
VSASSCPAEVAAVIPTTGHSPWLGATVRQLLADAAVSEIILVDDRAGAPGPLPGVDGHDARVRVVRSGGGAPALARQRGVEEARAPIVLLLDDDVVPGPALATGHARRHAQQAGLVVVGSMPVAAGQRGVAARLYAADYDRRARSWIVDPAGVLRHLWTGNVSMRRDDALRVGLASESFSGRRHEDREFGLRCRAAGLRGVYAPELRAAHHYERAMEDFFADARAQGRERVDLHAVHPELGSVPLESFTENVPRPLRPVLGLARRPGGAAALRTALGALTAAAQATGATVVETRAAQLRRRVEQIDGAARRLAERRASAR